MARSFLTSIDLSKNQLLNAVIQNLATAPADPVEGQLYCNTADHNIYIWLNGAWETWVNAASLAAANRGRHAKRILSGYPKPGQRANRLGAG